MYLRHCFSRIDDVSAVEDDEESSEAPNEIPDDEKGTVKESQGVPKIVGIEDDEESFSSSSLSCE